MREGTDMELKSERIKLQEGLHLNLIETEKFKSNLISFYFTRPLNEEEVTKNALLPLVLKSGTKQYPTNLALEKKMEKLYGANFSVAVNKRGERQVIRFTMQWANGEYLGDSEYDYKVIDLLTEIIYNPLLEKDKAFKKDYVAREKKNLTRIINSRINNKRSYAIERCIEEMCSQENFSLYELGRVNDLDHIDEKNLYKHYIDFLATSPIEIFFVGQYDDKLIEYLKQLEQKPREDIIFIPEDKLVEAPKVTRNIKEAFDINQGKLVMGYRSSIKYDDALYNAFLVAGDILGGGANSKLFKHVREEASLAYYISTTIYKYKSILLIDSGIEFEDFERTVEITKKQIDDLKNGIFTEKDMEVSIQSLKTSTESIKDSIFLIAEFFFSQLLSKDKRTLEQIIEDFRQVKKEEVIEAAKSLSIDTIYFMEKK